MFSMKASATLISTQYPSHLSRHRRRQGNTLFYARHYALAADHSDVDTEDSKLLKHVGANDKLANATQSGEASGRFVVIQTGSLICNIKEMNVSRNGKSLTLIFN